MRYSKRKPAHALLFLAMVGYTVVCHGEGTYTDKERATIPVTTHIYETAADQQTFPVTIHYKGMFGVKDLTFDGVQLLREFIAISNAQAKDASPAPTYRVAISDVVFDG